MNKFYKTKNGQIARALGEPDERGWLTLRSLSDYAVMWREDLITELSAEEVAEAIEYYDAHAAERRERVLGKEDYS